jgi:hypothetical protein
MYWVKASGVGVQVADGFGYGVTAHDPADAIGLLAGYLQYDEKEAKSIFDSVGVIEDVAEIEQNHVRPNMGNHLRRGIWFPAISDQSGNW